MAGPLVLLSISFRFILTFPIALTPARTPYFPQPNLCLDDTVYCALFFYPRFIIEGPLFFGLYAIYCKNIHCCICKTILLYTCRSMFSALKYHSEGLHLCCPLFRWSVHPQQKSESQRRERHQYQFELQSLYEAIYAELLWIWKRRILQGYVKVAEILNFWLWQNSVFFVLMWYGKLWHLWPVLRVRNNFPRKTRYFPKSG